MTAVAKSGPPVAKILLGCGCLAIVLIIAAAVAIMGVGAFATKKVYDENKETFTEGAQAIKDLRNASKRAQESNKANDKANHAGEEDAPATPALESHELLTMASSPLTPEQAHDHLKFMTAWEGSESVKEFTASAKKLQAQDRPKGELTAAEKVRALSTGISFYSNLSEATHEFDALAKAHGGVDAVLSRTFVSIALTSAARDLSEQRKIEDPASDKIAALMLKERDKHAALFDQLLEAQRQRLELAKLVSEGVDQSKLDALTKTLEASSAKSKEAADLIGVAPGLLLLGRIDEGSLKTWSSLSKGERAELLKVGSTLPTIPHLVMIPQIQSQRVLSSWLVGAELSRATAELFKEAAEATDEP